MLGIDAIDWEAKRAALSLIYRRFEEAAADFKASAVCAPACSFCCSDAGRIDITTLEGLIISQQIEAGWTRSRRHSLFKRIKQQRRRLAKGDTPGCPLLSKKQLCTIYDQRPFSCRQLYSLKRCGPQGPVIHRQVHALAAASIKKIQALDDTGYSGHISHMLWLLADADFARLYRRGDFNPRALGTFGKDHGLVINRMVSSPVAQSSA